jgi:predicted enzyme related to lactoylglutathione lyase
MQALPLQAQAAGPAGPAPPGAPLFRHIESVVLFVPDIHAAAQWYAALLAAEVRYENPQYAYLQAPGLLMGFHPADSKCPGGVGGTTAYWEVANLQAAVALLQARGARLHRGPALTDLGAQVAMMVDPFGCTLGLNQAAVP